MKKLIALLLFLAFSAVPAFAVPKTYHITTSGIDTLTRSGENSTDQAWRTVQFGANQLQCGDTLEVHLGTYSVTGASVVGYDGRPATNHQNACSSWNNSITIKATTGDAVTLASTSSGAIISVNGSNGGNGAACPPDDQSNCKVMTDVYWTFQGFIIDGTNLNARSSDIVVDYVNHVKFIDNEVKNSTGIGISANADNGYHALQAGQSCADNPSVTTGQLCYYSQWDRPISDLQIMGGSIHDSAVCGTASCTAGGGYGAYLSVSDSLLYGVTIYSNRGLAAQFSNSGSRKLDNNIACKNIVYSNRSGIIMTAGAGDIACNNLFYSSNEDFQLAIGPSGGCTSCYALGNTVIGGANMQLQGVNITSENNLVYNTTISDTGTGTSSAGNLITTDATLFTHPGSAPYDFTLASSAGAAIQKGVDLSSLVLPGSGADYVLIDLAGLTRLNPPSIGAYDFGGVAVAAVTSISPTFLTRGDTAQTITFTGGATHFDIGSIADTGCSGVTASAATVLIDATHVRRNFTVAANATVATCDVTVVTSNAGETATGTSLFSVHAAGTASVVSITPSTAAQGTATLITVVLANATAATTTTTVALSGSQTGITYGATTAQSATQFTFTLTLASSAAAGMRDFTVTTAANGALPAVTNGFTITSSALCATGIVAGQCVHHSNDASGSTTWVSSNLPSAVSTVAGHYTYVLLTTVKSADGTATTNRPVSSVVGTLGNTYTMLCSSATNLQFQQEIWQAPATSGGTESVTATYGATVYYTTGELIEAAGRNTTSPKDVCGKATGTSTTPSVSLDSTTTVDNDLVLAVVANFSGDIPAPAVCTGIEAVPGNSFVYKVQTPVGTSTCSWTQPSALWFAIMVALKPNVATPASISTVSPASGYLLNTDLNIAITGTNSNFTSSTSCVFDDMGGIAQVSWTRNSATSGNWHISIAAGATLSARTVTCTTGTENAVSSVGAFTVTGTRETLLGAFSVTDSNPVITPATIQGGASGVGRTRSRTR